MNLVSFANFRICHLPNISFVALVGNFAVQLL
jgi:hypothetical protein